MKLYSLVPGSGADDRAWLAPSPLTVPRESVCTLVRLREKKKKERKKSSRDSQQEQAPICGRLFGVLGEDTAWVNDHPEP